MDLTSLAQPIAMNRWNTDWNADMVTVGLFFLVLVLVGYILPHRWRIIRRLPPGPRGIPILGCLPFVGREPHKTLRQLSDQYGPVFSVYLGSKLFVFIGDVKLVREAFKKDVFADRPSIPFVDVLMEGYGVANTNGSLWREQRRFTQAALRDAGFAKTASHKRSCVEEHSVQNIQLMLAELERLDGDSVDVSLLLGCTILNNFYALVAGTKPYRLFDPVVVKQIESNDDAFKRTEMLGVINFFPWLLWLPPFKKNLSVLYNYKLQFHQMTKPVISQHEESLNHDYPRDLIDAYLIRMKKQQSQGNDGHFSEPQLLHLLGDLFGAGLGTTQTTLCWFFLAMMKHPEIQIKVQEELDTVVGRERKPCLSDLPHLPYTEATLMETQRYATILPTGISHAAAHDTELAGYFIPKGAVVSGLFWNFHHDPKVWKNPATFDPTHFLTPEGKMFKPDNFMPFSVGKRLCLGEDVAKMSFYLIATHILQEFTITLAPESENVQMIHSSTFLLSPPSFKMVVQRRQNSS